MTERLAIISTSDRAQFRGCRRKWDWSSHLRQGFAPHEQATPLWFGSGFHHCMEDIHGLQAYENNRQAWDDYSQATTKFYGDDGLPYDKEELGDLGVGILDYYEDVWLKARGRDPLTTYEIDGEPQVEVPFEFEVPVDPAILKAGGYDRAVYKGVIDRMVIDRHGHLYIVDYKSVKTFGNRQSLELDPQIGVYLWAATAIFKRPVMGFYYMQFKKTAAHPPNINKNGEMSVAKNQSTSYWMIRKYMIEKYGSVEKGPITERDFLNHFLEFEDDDKDNFIQRTLVTRDPRTLEQESKIVIAEVADMLTKELSIYPNPNFLCGATCAFVQPCIEMNQGLNFQETLKADYYLRDYKERSSWSQYLEVNPHGGKEDRKASGLDVLPTTAANKANTKKVRPQGKGTGTPKSVGVGVTKSTTTTAKPKGKSSAQQRILERKKKRAEKTKA